MSSDYETVTKDGKVRAVHDVLAEKIIGRPLKENEVVHHINGDKRDNSPENLLVIDRAEHNRLHQQGAKRSPETLDKLRKKGLGRPSSGRKLNRAQVVGIAEKLIAGVPLKEISGEYGVSDRTVMAIRDGKSYRDFLQDYPDAAFPLRRPNRRSARRNTEGRKLSEERVNAVRLSLWSGESVAAIAEREGVTERVIQMIRDGELYKDVPWPEKIDHVRKVTDMAELARIFLSEPMSRETDEYTALREDYHIIPDLESVIMLRLVRRALAGDAELAVLLLWLGGFREETDAAFREESVILRTFMDNS